MSAISSIGHGACIPSMKIDAYAGIDVKGKFVLAQLVAPKDLCDPAPVPGEGEPERPDPRAVECKPREVVDTRNPSRLKAGGYFSNVTSTSASTASARASLLIVSKVTF